jgi:hypothetical protein
VKKTFIILTLLLAFNFGAPNTQAMTLKIRHVIEYTEQDKSRDLTGDEILKNKIVLFMRLQMLTIKIAAVNSAAGFNTS